MGTHDSDRFRHGIAIVGVVLFVLALGALFATLRAGIATSGRPISPPASPPVSPPVRPHPGPTINEIQTQSFNAYVPCANAGSGEVITGTIDLHVLVISTLNDNNVSGFYQYQPAGGSLVGTITGDAYRPTGKTESSFSGSLQNGRYTTTFVNNFRLIGPGPGNNYLVHQIYHLTFDANGELTVDHELSSVECK